ncbi:MAG TPA: HAD family hydrolase, partial [Paracoccaceae bacterium]|nr:HAD family hydrolase [Paracoccaceae bacterium]
MAPGRIRGLLFDKDGTLFDFAATWAVVTERLLDVLAPDAEARVPMGHAVGYDAATRRFVPGSPMVAGTVQDCAALWARFRPDLGADRIAELAERITGEAVAGGALVPAHADLAGFLAELRADGYRLGVATNDSEAAARQQLAVAGILAAFDFVAGADSGHGAKPGPGMLIA